MNTPLQSANANPISYQQAFGTEEAIKHLIPQKFNDELLIKRVKQGGDSGEYLAQAFISAYCMTEFKGSLGRIIYLDIEGLALFIDILHIRKIKGWSDSEYHAICCEIKDIIGDKA